MSLIQLAPQSSHRAACVDPSSVVSLANYFSPNRPMVSESLFQNAEALFSCLEQQSIPHVLVGGLALLIHAEGRNTEDVDLIMTLPDTARLPNLVMEDQNEWFGRGKIGNLQVDFLFTANPVFSMVAQHHTEDVQFRGRQLKAATAEGLMLLKLYALPSLYRQGQTGRAAIYEADLALLLLASQLEDEPLLQKLSSHMLPSDINALKEVLKDVRGRLNRRF